MPTVKYLWVTDAISRHWEPCVKDRDACESGSCGSWIEYSKQFPVMTCAMHATEAVLVSSLFVPFSRPIMVSVRAFQGAFHEDMTSDDRSLMLKTGNWTRYVGTNGNRNADQGSSSLKLVTSRLLVG